MLDVSDNLNWSGLNGYKPRPFFVDLHTRKQRWAVIVAHRRCGKTVACIADLIFSAFLTKKQDARFCYIAPQYNQAKDVAWVYVKRLCGDIEGVSFNESELRADFPNGARVRLYGAENPDRLRGIYLDGCLIDEYADMSPRMWSEVIRPALADRKGWALFIGTPKGRNQFWELYDNATRDPEWYYAMLKASQTGILAQDELNAARKMMTEDQYEQEFECSFQAALIGAYYGREIGLIEKRKQITRVAWEPQLEVHTGWDLGMDDSTAIWFMQAVGNEIRLIDCYDNSGMGLDHYVKVLREKPYTYGNHYLPHDTEVRELGTGKSRKETLMSLGLRPFIVPQQRLEDGINAVRLMLPKCYFDTENTKQGLEALRQYQREWNDKTRTFSQKPLHNWASHYADAFRYLAFSLGRIANYGQTQTQAKVDFNPLDF